MNDTTRWAGVERVYARGRPHVVTPSLVAVVLRVSDLLILAIAGMCSLALRQGDLDFSGIELTSALVVVLLAGNVTSSLGAYDGPDLSHMGRQFRRAVLGWCIAIGALLVFSFLLKTSDQISRLWILSWLGLGIVGLAGARIAVSAWLRRLRRLGLVGRRVLVMGRGADGEERVRFIEGNEPDAAVLGYVDLARSPAPPVAMGGMTRLTDLNDVPRFLRITHVDHVILAMPWDDQALIRRVVDQLRAFPVEVTLIPEGNDDGLFFHDVAMVGGVPGLKLLDRPLDEYRTLVKALEDRILGWALLIAALPLLAILALAVKLTSPGPVLFRQRRAGFNANVIEVFKFRSMYVEACDAPDARHVQQASRGDPRVTPLGRFLRRTSLDELPQLFNVIRGEMSLVGPRPHALAHDDHYAESIDGYLSRHRVKPGITGWAQVNGLRGEVTDIDQMRRRIQFDLQYIDHWSLWFDLYIVLRTVGLVFWDRKAF